MWFAFFMWVATSIVSALLTKGPKNAAASGLGDITVPTAEEGRTLSVFHGTCKISGPNVVWWGDLRQSPIKVKSGGFLGIGAKSQTIGYKISLGMQMVLGCGLIDELQDIIVGDKSLKLAKTSKSCTAGINTGTGSVSDIQLTHLARTETIYIMFDDPSNYQVSSSYDTALGHGVVGERFLHPRLSFVIGQGGVAFVHGDTFQVQVTTPWVGTYAADGLALTVSNADLFGGDKSEGGISGTLRFYFGSMAQPGNAYLARQFGKATSGLRGLCYAVLECMYLGTSKYIKDWAWVASSWPCASGLDPTKRNIAYDANPSYMIADILTRPREKGGRGVPISRLNLAAFQSAADALFTERFGMTLNYDQAQSADAWISEICRTIDGTCYTDPATGLWTLKLVRADYVLADLPEFTVGDVKSVEDFTRSSWPDTMNQVVVRYLDRSQDFTIRTVKDRDAANIAIRQMTATKVTDYLGVSRHEIAALVAARDKRALSYPVARARLTLNRKGWALRPGSPFKLTWAPLGITGMVCRVQDIRYGSFEEGRIQVDVIEDVFDVTTAAYTSPIMEVWTNPIGAPAAAIAQALLEAPYWVVGQNRFVMTLAAGAESAADIWSSESGAAWEETGALEALTPSGLLVAPWSAKTAALDSVGIEVESGSHLYRLESTDAAGRTAGLRLALIGDEIVAWTTVVDNEDGTYAIAGILRGVMDTVPSDHAAGARVYFFTEGQGYTRDSVAPSDGSLSPATDSDLGGVIPTADSFAVDAAGFLTLKPATTSSLGGVKVGTGLQITQAGVLRVDGNAGMTSRAEHSWTTGSLNNGATENIDAPLCKTSKIYKVETDVPAWVRLYSTDAARTADSARADNVFPSVGDGVMLDTITTALKLSVPIEQAEFTNQDSPVADVGYLAVTNKGTAGPVTLTLTTRSEEA